MSIEPRPDWLPEISEEGLWAKLQMRFDAFSALFDMRPETQTEAVGEKRPSTKGGREEWVDTAPRWDGERPWLLLPYIDALDQAKIQEHIETGRELRDYIHSCLQRRELSVYFLHTWGRFCAAAGVLEFLYWSETNVGGRRAGKAGGDAKEKISEDHKRWFAHYFLPIYEGLSKGDAKRERADNIMETVINEIVDKKITIPPPFEVDWFYEFLDFESGDRKRSPLRDAYRERKFSVSAMKKLVAQGNEGIPPVDLEFPAP